MIEHSFIHEWMIEWMHEWMNAYQWISLKCDETMGVKSQDQLLRSERTQWMNQWIIEW